MTNLQVNSDASSVHRQSSLGDESAGPQRLQHIPWSSLAGLAPLLEAPLAHILDGEAAERVLDRFLRAHRGFTSDQRSACSEALFGVGLWRRRLRAQMGAQATPLVLLGSFLRDLACHPNAPAILGVDLPAAAPLTDWRDRFSLPDWLAQALQRESDEPEVLAAALGTPAPLSLRANRLLTDQPTLLRELAQLGVHTRPGRLARDALVVTSTRPNLLPLPPYRAGHFEVQDEASQLVSEFLGLGAGEEVLDLCAGAGGKTLHLASLVGRGGVVHACDLDPTRLERLRHRARRAQADSIIRICGPLPPPHLRVPWVLVDAPCSELGTLRRGPDLRWRLNPASFARLPSLQLELLERAVSHLGPYGRLLYATCTIRSEENEHVVSELCRRAPLRLLASRRTWPHREGTDGFFMALLTRTA